MRLASYTGRERMIIFKPLVWLIRLPIVLIRLSFKLAKIFLSWFQWGDV